MENNNKEIYIEATNQVTEDNNSGTNWGLYAIILFSFALLAAMLVTAYYDHL